MAPRRFSSRDTKPMALCAREDGSRRERLKKLPRRQTFWAEGWRPREEPPSPPLASWLGRWQIEMNPPILYDGLPPEDLKMVAVGPRYSGDVLGIDPRTWPEVVNMYIPAPGQDFDGELALKDIVSVRLAPERGVTFVA